MLRYVPQAAQRFPTPVVSVLGPALGNVFLIKNPWIGALLWLGIFQDVRHAAFALLGIAVSEGIVRVFRMGDPSPASGCLKANAVLAAVAVAWLTTPIHIPVETQIVMATLVTALATVFSAAIVRVLSDSDLPALVLGYCGAAVILFAVFHDWTPIASAATEWPPVPNDPLAWIDLFFRSLGSLLYLPEVGVGLVLGATVLIWSRAAFAAGLVGWIAGVGASTALMHVGVIYYWMPTSYNFFLSGLGLGAVFFLPGRGSLLIAAVGGFTAAVFAVALQHLFPTTAFGYLPIASALTIWIGIKAMGPAGEQKMFRRNLWLDLPPEQAWWRAAYWLRRVGEPGPLLVVPVGGKALVSQGTDGETGHAGSWRHALDFQCPPSQISAGAAQIVWDAPVTAPAAGTVARVENGVADNPVGASNFASPLGNYVVLRLDQGDWALLGHLRQNSIAVQPGDRVEIGSFLGKVGNSGRSSVSHLHMQVQASPEPGAPTVPFRLANYLETLDSERPLLQWTPAGIPAKGAVVAHALSNAPAAMVLTSFAPGAGFWTVEFEGQIPRIWRRARFAATARTTVALNEAGQHVMRTSNGGALVIKLDPDAWRIVEQAPSASPLLQLLCLAIPSIPYAASAGMIWCEPAPLYPRTLGLSLAPYMANPFTMVRCRCVEVGDGENDAALTVETRLETPWRGLPTKVTCRFERLRGPTRVEAEFDGGRILCSLLTFEPGLPMVVASA